MKRGKVLLLLIAAGLFFSACSNNPPEILQSYWQLSLIEQIGSTGESVLFREELAVFVISRDEDGDDEIESLFLIQDEEELFWELDRDNWEEVEIQGESWLGASRLVMPVEEIFPRQEYRLLVIDKSGQRDENTFALSVKRILEPPVFGRLIRDGDTWTIDSPHNRHTLKAYSSQGELKKEIKIQAKIFTDRFLREELKISSGDKIVLTASDDEKGWLLESLPVDY